MIGSRQSRPTNLGGADGDRASKSRASVVTLISGSCWLAAMTIWYVWITASTLNGFLNRIPVRRA